MSAAHVDAFVAAARQTYYAPGEAILQPGDGPVARPCCIRRGGVAGGQEGADAAGSGFLLEQGDLFPVAACLGQRPVSASYEAPDDCFCLDVPAEALRALVQRSVVLADFLNGRVQQILALSKQAVKSTYASQVLAEQSMEARLGSLPRRPLVACAAHTPLLDVLHMMQRRRVGSVLVLDGAGAALGIFTRHDVLERVALGQPPTHTPVSQLMTHPVHTLDVGHTLQDVVLLMSRHGILHVPVTEQGCVVNMVSERDLFAMQRLSLKRLSSTLRAAGDLQALIAAAPDIRRIARTLLTQGLSARSLTVLVSHLNDVLTARAVELVADQHGLDLKRACWLGFGSEGRSEQTIATDQDNGLVFAGDKPDAERPAWLAMARQVNDTLDACGYPLCTGQIMAGNEECCLSADEWIARFGRWIDQGAPEDLLKAGIVGERECQTWIGAFEFLQMLRLRVQVDSGQGGGDASPNRLDMATLNDIDRRILKESFRAAQRLQQRITLDYMR